MTILTKMYEDPRGFWVGEVAESDIDDSPPDPTTVETIELIAKVRGDTPHDVGFALNLAQDVVPAEQISTQAAMEEARIAAR